MKKAFKILSFILALTLLIGSFASCSEKKVQTGDSFTYWVSLNSFTAQTLSSYNELLMYQEMAKATGTNVEFIHPSAGSTGSEAFQVLLSSNDYPDMIEYEWETYAGGPGQAIEDGVIIALNDYMKDYAPNYYDYMEGEKGKENGYLYKAQSITTEGNYFGFRNLNIGNLRGFSGIYVRDDLLKKWGLDIPQTIDDWTVVLKTAKENGFKAPLTGTKHLFSVVGGIYFSNAWHVGSSWYLVGDEVKFGPFESEYKNYLAKMAEWAKNGYIDPDYVTNDATNVQGYMTNGSSIATTGFVGGGIGALLPAMADRDPDYSLSACPYPVMKKGDVPWFQELQPESNDSTIAISVQCGIDNEDRYKEAIKWCDYLYGEEGSILKSFGVEGKTYTIEKGEDGKDHFIYTDAIYDHEKIGAHSVAAALYHFFRPANTAGTNQHPDYLNGFYPYEQQKEAMVVWNKYIDEAKKHTYPPVNYTGEEATQMANIESKGRDNLDAAISNIILGKASIDTWDDAIKAAKKAGYKDLLKIQQTAYDRYNKIIKDSK